MYILSGELVIISKTKSLKKLQSINFHVFLLIFAGGVMLECIIAICVAGAYKNSITETRTEDVIEYASDFSEHISDEGLLANSKKQLESECNIVAKVCSGRLKIYEPDGYVLYDTYGTDTGTNEDIKEIEKLFCGAEKYVSGYKKNEVTVYVPVMASDGSSVEGILYIEASVRSELEAIDKADKELLIFIVLITALLFFAAAVAADNISKPIKKIEESIEHVADGYMDDEIKIKGYYEVERISDIFNVMLNNMRHTEESRQEFVSNVSHELKTPMTSIKVLTDSLLGQPDAPIEMYREFLKDISDEIDRENSIITDLLNLVKLDKKSGEMNINSINVNELLEIILKRLRPIANKKNVEIIYESFRPVVAEVDEVKISLAMSNLIENAVKYNVDNGWVRVSLNCDHRYFYVTVADSGIGISEEAQKHIFERFYRVDKARSRQTGGTGLGLAITKSVILMHNGSIKVYSKEDEGTTFTMRIPLSYKPPVQEEQH